jgi:hypothetical protein
MIDNSDLAHVFYWLFVWLCNQKLIGTHSCLPAKAEPWTTHAVNRDSGTAATICLRSSPNT